MANNIFDNEKEMEAFIRGESGNTKTEGRIIPTEHHVIAHRVSLGDSVTTSEGDVMFERDSDSFGLYHFKISLGPSNSKRLLEFLFALPDEPEEE